MSTFALERQGASALLLRLEIESFLYREAGLVDDRRYDEWLELFSEDFEYRVPLVRNLAAAAINNEYLTGPLDISWFHEDKATLATRIAQIKTGVHWAEEPLSRTSHLITNVEIQSAMASIEEADDIEVTCKFLINRNRATGSEDTLIGKRLDCLRRAGESWSIYRRTVYLNQTVLQANSLSFFV